MFEVVDERHGADLIEAPRPFRRRSPLVGSPLLPWQKAMQVRAADAVDYAHGHGTWSTGLSEPVGS